MRFTPSCQNNTHFSISDTFDESNVPLVLKFSDNIPPNSMFFCAKSTITNRAISPIYIPLIIFSNLKPNDALNKKSTMLLDKIKKTFIH